jgi:hypothetical protein
VSASRAPLSCVRSVADSADNSFGSPGHGYHRPVSVPTGAEPERLDRALRITAGVLGVIVAVPSFLAFGFVVLFVWLGSDDTPLWLAVPLGILAVLQLYLAIRTLSARLATAVTVGLLGVLELAVGFFLLIGSPTLLPATVGAIVVVFVAGVVALAAAVRIHLNGTVAPTSTPAFRIRVGRKRSTSPDMSQPIQNGARPKATPRPGGAPISDPAQKSGAKKPARKK